MFLSKRIFLPLAILSLVLSTSVFSSDILVDTTIEDVNHDGSGGYKYEIDKMDVKWDKTGQITVDVYTNFTQYNNKYNPGDKDKNIIFGDLLIGTQGIDKQYDYAFKLTSGRKGDYSKVDSATNTGKLFEISSTRTSKQYHGSKASVRDDQVFGKKTGSSLNKGNWTINNNHHGFNKISFNFNVSGIAAFQNASQLALSWAMSCANDVVNGVVNVNQKSSKPTTSVPEPSTMLLMLIAFAYFASRRNNLLKK